jgi:RNA polymerase sigma-70 factor, ECF subfamily
MASSCAAHTISLESKPKTVRRVLPELSNEVVARAQGGDRAAQTEVLKRYAGPLHGFIARTWPRVDAEEMTQVLLQRLLVVLPKFEFGGSASLSTWVFSVAQHFLIDEQRKQKPQLVPLHAANQVVDGQRDAVSVVWRQQVRSALDDAIGKLPPEQARVVVLVHLYEQPLEAVAEVEGVPLGTIKSRLFRARASLAARLGPTLLKDLS